MLSVRNSLYVLTLLVCGSFVATLTASQADSTGYSQFNKVNGIHKNIQNAMANIKSGLERTGEMMEEITCEQIAKAIASFSQLKSNHTEFVTESSKLPNNGCHNLFHQLIEGEYKKGNTKENLKQLAANISEQEQKLIQSLALRRDQLREQSAKSSTTTVLNKLHQECLELAKNCSQISQGKDFSEESKKSAAGIGAELATLSEQITTKSKHIAETEDETKALNQLIVEHRELDEKVVPIVGSENKVSEQELMALKTRYSRLVAKFNALVLQTANNRETRSCQIDWINRQSKELEEKIQQQQIVERNIFQRLAHALTKKQYIVTALVSITVVAGLAYGEHKHKVLSKFIFGQARAPEQILTQLSWWARTRNWFSGWLNRLTSLNRVRI